MTKTEIRKNNLKLRVSLDNKEIKNEKILKMFLSWDLYKNAKTVMTYISYKSEIDTKRLVDIMIKDKKILCAPVCFSDGLMEAYMFSDQNHLKQSKMGIPEPETKKKVLPNDIDLIVVPGCAFNDTGYRIGYGGGFYDRYLKNTNALTCGLFYEALKCDFTPDETDVPLNFIITENKIYNFKVR